MPNVRRKSPCSPSRADWIRRRRGTWRVREVVMPAKCAWCGGPTFAYPAGENRRASVRCRSLRCCWRWIAP